VTTNTPPPGAADGPEYLGSAEATGDPTYFGTGPGGGRSWGILAGVTVAVLAVVGLGGWGAFTLLSGGGSQPSEAFPADTIGYVSIDLDPAADQKIEGLSILRKFPGIEKELDISDRDDLRRYVFEKIQDEGECKDVDYEEDIAPWIGDRLGVGAVPQGEDDVAALVALQVTDQEAAPAGLDALARCGGGDDAEFGYAFSGDYAVITETTKQARLLADEAAEGSLADDETFQARMSEVGDSGIVTMYASADAPDYLVDLQESMFAVPDAGVQTVSAEPLSEQGVVLTSGPIAPGSDQMPDEMTEQLKKLYADFEGMAGVVRFEDGAVEFEFAAAGMPSGLPGGSTDEGTGVTELPASTGAAMALALPDNWLEEYLRQISAVMGEGMSIDEMLSQLEQESGLSLPEDVETLLGDNVAIAVDADTDFEALESSEDGRELLAGIKVQGEPEEILPIVEKIKAKIGPEADRLVVEDGDGVVAFGLNPDYVEGLLSEGDLGDEESFQDVVPDAEDASSVFYVNFDAGDGWALELAEQAGEGAPEAKENVEPLDALGLSTWVDDDVQHALFRMTTD
jgi:hypothetical protein